MDVKFRLTRTRAVMLALTLALGACGLAYAAIPGTSGVISGCYDGKTGVLRVIDADAGQSCGTGKETALSWNQIGPQGPQGIQGPQGAQGPQGPAGTAEAYAQIGPDGTVNAAFARGFDGVTVTHPATGIYCIEGLAFQPKVALGGGLAGLGSTDGTPAGLHPAQYDTVVTASILANPSASFLAFCDDALGGPTPTVRIYVFQAGSTGPPGLVDRPFRILFND